MNRLLFYSLASLALSSFVSCLQEKGAELATPDTFVRYFNGGNNDVAVAVEETPDGGLILLGNSEIAGAEVGDPTSHKIKLIRTDAFGNQQWKQLYPPYGQESAGLGLRARSLQVRKDTNGDLTGYVIVGDSIDDSGTAYLTIMTTDPEGNVQKNKTLSTHPGVQGLAASISQNESYYVLGSATPDQMILAELDGTSLSEQWYRSYPSGQSSLAWKLLQDGAGDVVWSGTVIRNGQSDIRIVKSESNRQSTEYDRSIGKPEFNESCIDICPYTNFFAVAGTTNEKDGAAGDRDILFTLLRSDGSVAATATYDFHNQDDNANAISISGDGGFVILGTVQSTVVSNVLEGHGEEDLYLIKIGTFGGDPEWTRLIGSQNEDTGASVRATSDGGYVVLGTTRFGGLQTMMLVKTDGQGRIR